MTGDLYVNGQKVRFDTTGTLSLGAEPSILVYALCAAAATLTAAVIVQQRRLSRLMVTIRATG